MIMMQNVLHTLQEISLAHATRAYESQIGKSNRQICSAHMSCLQSMFLTPNLLAWYIIYRRMGV